MEPQDAVQNTTADATTNPATTQPTAQSAAESLSEVRPQEIYERMTAYVTETDNLISMLHENLKKGESQLTEIASFDSRVTQLKNGLTPIDTASLQANIDDVRKHIASLEEFRGRVKTDMDKVKQITESISGIITRYQSTS